MEKYPIGTAYVDGRWSPENPFGSHDDDAVVLADAKEIDKEKLTEKYPMVLMIGGWIYRTYGGPKYRFYFYDNQQPYPKIILYCITFCSAIPEKEILLEAYSLGRFAQDAHEYVEQILRWREFSPSFSARAMKTFAYALVQWAWEKAQPGSYKTEVFYTKKGIYQYAQTLECPVLLEAILRETEREYSPEEIEACLQAAGWDFEETLRDDSLIVFEKERFAGRRENGIPMFPESPEDVLEERSYGYMIFPWRIEEGEGYGL